MSGPGTLESPWVAEGPERRAGGTVDADAHVIECEETWDFLEGPERRFRPAALSSADGSGRTVWGIDGRVFARAVGDPTIPLDVREMRDVAGRIAAMDRFGIDVQVLYPTLFLATLSDRPEVQVALARCYNRWMATVCSKSAGRLRWVVLAPLCEMGEALAELEFGKAHGACGVFLRGLEEHRVLADPALFPLYERASALDLPLCIHAGNGNVEVHDVLFGDPAARVQDVFFAANLPVLAAFHLLVVMGIPERFPDLRVGFIEAGAQWVPYLIGEARRRQGRMGTLGTVGETRSFLAEKRLYVTCRTDNDLVGLLEELGDANFVIGTDYGHKDAAAEVDAFRTLQRAGTIPGASLDKVMGRNARALYGI